MAASVLALIEEIGKFQGTATELQNRCKEKLGEDEAKHKSYSKTSATFSRRLKQVSHNLRELGIEIEFFRGKERIISIKYKGS